MSNSIVIYILTSPVKHGEIHSFHAMLEDTSIVEGKVIPSETDKGEKLLRRLKEDSYVLVQKYSLTTTPDVNYMKLTLPTSKVFQTGSKFAVPKEKLHDFYHAPLCTVPEATVSPKKRRLSVRGTVSQVYAVRSGATWRRRDVYLEDGPTAKRICVKLWGEHADRVTETNKGDIITVENVEVDIFKDTRQLKSTDLTAVIMDNTSSVTSGDYRIIGVSDEDGDNLTLITDEGVEFLIPEDLFTANDMTVNGS